MDGWGISYENRILRLFDRFFVNWSERISLFPCYEKIDDEKIDHEISHDHEIFLSFILLMFLTN